MKDVVPIRSRKSTPFMRFRNALKDNDPNFFLGLLVSLVLPQVIASTYFGNFMTVVFGGCALVATGLGLTIYQRFPYRIESCVSKGQQATSAREDLRKAA